MPVTDPELISRANFSADLTQLIREKLAEAVKYVPYSEEESRPAVGAGWFCIEPPTHCTEPMWDADAFTLSYTGVQEGISYGDNPDALVRSTVTSLQLFKDGDPYENCHSVLACADAPPVIVNQALLEPAVDSIDTPITSLGNWGTLSIAEKQSMGNLDAHLLSGAECRSILAAIARAQVDHSTLISSIKAIRAKGQ